MKKLTDLGARFMDNSQYLYFECPCGEADRPLLIPLDPPLGGGPPAERAWRREGDTIETITLRPSILRMEGCKWHGWITDGEAVPC